MAASLYYAPLPFTATPYSGSPITGYPASNVESHRITRPWRATSTGFKGITCDLGSEMDIAAALFQDVNIPPTTAYHTTYTAPDSGVFTARGGCNVLLTDPFGRARGLKILNLTGIRYVRFGVNDASVPTDGAIYWNIGAIYIFASGVAPMAKAPRYGVSQEIIKPSQDIALPNGQFATVSLGPHRTSLSLDYDDLIDSSDDVQAIYRATRQGPICLSLGYQGWDFWPLELADQDARMQWSDYRVNRFSMRLREII